MQWVTLVVLLLAIIGSNTHAQVLETTPSPEAGTAFGYVETPQCNSSQDCLSCSDIPGCGWCDVTQECLTGSGAGPTNTTCPSWFYYSCFSTGDTSSCSQHIATMSCDETQCDETKTNYNADVCDHCRSVEACFDQEENVSCPGLNDDTCPNGLPARNDSAPPRNIVQMKDNVKAIDPAETTLYFCPVVFPPDLDEGATLLMTRNPTGFQEGDVIVSGQAGGIMHTVDRIISYGPYAFVMANAANMEDVLSFVSYHGRIDPVPIEDEATVEHIPDESLLLSALNGDLQSNVTFHAIQEDTNVYKCVGERYISSLDDEWTSTFFIIKKSDFQGFSMSIGDVIVSNYSLGWLETVMDISSNEDPEFSYAETKLVNCAEMLPNSDSLLGSGSDLHCEGGDNSVGLMVYKDRSEEDLNFQVGDTVVGRRSGPFMSKVMSWTEEGDFVFIEASPVSDETDLTAVMDSTHSVRRRRKVFPGFQFPRPTLENRVWTATLTREAEGPRGVTAKGEAKVSIEPYLKFRFEIELDVDWGIWPPVQSAEARFVGDAGFGIKASASISGSISKTWTKKLKEGTVPPEICFPILGPFCLPSKVRYVINASLEISASIAAEVKVEGRADAGATFGAVWQHGNGLRPIFKRKLEFTSKRSASAEVKGTVTLKGTIAPILTVDLPVPRMPVNIPRWVRWALPDWLTGESTGSGRSVFTLFSPTLSIPIIAEVAAKLCPALERIDWKAGIEEVVASVKIGIKNWSVDLSKKIILPRSWTYRDKEEFPYCNDTTTPPPTTTMSGYETTTFPRYNSTFPYDTTMTPYNTTTIPYDTTTTPYDTTTTPYDTTTTPYDTTTTPYDTTTTPYDTTTTPYDTTTTPYEPNTIPYGTTESFGTTPSLDIPVPCVADLVFLIDGSWSIGQARFKEAKQFIQDIVKCLNTTDVRVGVIQFHCESKWAISLGKYADRIQLLNAIIKDVVYEGGDRSRVGSAIYHMMCTTRFRDNARNVAIILTDGRFGGLYAGRAQEARDDGIELYGTAVGRRAFIQMSGLTAITGNPARVVQWRQVDPCVFAATLCNSG